MKTNRKPLVNTILRENTNALVTNALVTNALRNTTHFHHNTILCGEGVLALEIYVTCFETCFMLEATEFTSVPGDVVISECMTLQC